MSENNIAGTTSQKFQLLAVDQEQRKTGTVIWTKGATDHHKVPNGKMIDEDVDATLK